MAIAMDLTILDVRWPIFFFWWIISSTDFSTFSEKMKNIYQLKNEILSTKSLKFFLAFRLSVRRF